MHMREWFLAVRYIIAHLDASVPSGDSNKTVEYGIKLWKNGIATTEKLCI